MCQTPRSIEKTQAMLVIAIAAIILYSFSGVAWLRTWPQSKLSLASACLAVTLHIMLTFDQSYSGSAINFSFTSVSNIISACITLIAVCMSFFLRVHKVAAPLLLLAAVNIIMSLLSGSSLTTPISLSMAAHILPSVIAYSLFSLASVLACILWLQHSALKQHKLSSIIHDLPPIEIMEKMLFFIILIGYILLSVAIVSGLITIDDFFGQHLAHKTFFSILAWLIYSLLLYGHFSAGWRGTTAIKWTLGGFILLMLGFFGTKFVLEIIL